MHSNRKQNSSKKIPTPRKATSSLKVPQGSKFVSHPLTSKSFPWARKLAQQIIMWQAINFISIISLIKMWNVTKEIKSRGSDVDNKGIEKTQPRHGCKSPVAYEMNKAHFITSPSGTAPPRYGSDHPMPDPSARKTEKTTQKIIITASHFTRCMNKKKQQ